MSSPGKPRSKSGSKTRLADGRVRWRVSCGYDAAGRRVWRSGTAASETQADAEIALARASMARGTCARAERITLDTYYSAFFVKEREGSLTKATMQRYDGDYRRVIAPAFGARDVNEIEHYEIQQVISGLSNSSGKHVAATLRAILRAAWDDGFLIEEPMRHRLRYTPKPAAPLHEERPRVWTASQVLVAKEVLSGSPVEALWLLMVGAGLRREEAYALFFDEFAFEDRGGGFTYAVVPIDDAVTEADGRKDVKTSFSRRWAVVCPPFAARLQQLAQTASQTQPAVPVCQMRLTSLARFWRNLWVERKVATDGNGRYWKGAMLEAGLPYLTLPRMRATHETLMQGAGTLDTLNARVHGRSSVSQIGYRNYLDPVLETKLEAAEALGHIFGEGV